MNASFEATRRLTPRLWDTDWLVLGGLGHALNKVLDRMLRRNASVLDFGCGSMPYRSKIEDRGATYLGADFKPDAMVRMEPDGRLPVASCSFDVVLSVQVLEHVRNLDLYLAEARRVLKDNGMLVLSTHGTWLYHPHPEDHRRWTSTGLVADIEARGFLVRDIESVTGPLATTTLIRLAGYAFFLRRLPLVGAHLAALLAIVMNMRAWLEDKLTPESIRANNGCVYLVACTKTVQ